MVDSRYRPRNSSANSFFTKLVVVKDEEGAISLWALNCCRFLLYVIPPHANAGHRESDPLIFPAVVVGLRARASLD